MRSNMEKGLVIMLLLLLSFSCQLGKVPLDKDEFTSLLIDIHRVDGALAVNRGMGRYNELKNYAYYNDVFKKYNISRADFDSCMYYYSAQTVLFSKMYDVIIDTLNHQLTAADLILNELKSKDSINYFPIMDTLRLDSIYTVDMDSIVPGLYKFNTTIRFDTIVEGRARRLASYFLSADGTDTLRVWDITVKPDTIVRDYNWSQYVDSVYSRLVIKYLDILPAVKVTEPLYSGNGKKRKPAKKEKEIKLKGLGGEAWNNTLFRPYISRDMEQRLKQNIRHQK